MSHNVFTRVRPDIVIHHEKGQPKKDEKPDEEEEEEEMAGPSIELFFQPKKEEKTRLNVPS